MSAEKPELEQLLHSNINDRINAAKHGYRLDVLVTDTSYDVDIAIKIYLQKHKYDTIFDWAKDNNIDLDIDEWLKSDTWRKREAVANAGYCLDVLFDDKVMYVREAVQNYLQDHNYKSIFDWAKDNGLNIIDEWLHDNWHKRYEVAKAGYHLDVLFCDKNKDVREAVHNYLKEHNYESVIDWAKDNNVEINFDEWLHSGNWHKRLEVAKYGYRLDVLFDDVDEDVCIAVKNYLEEHNYDSVIDWAKDNNIEIDINEWLHSDNESKRREVAKVGYRLDVLFGDNDSDVRNTTKNYLKDHNYRSVFDWAKDNNVEINIDKWLKSDNWCKRFEVAKVGYRLDVLFCDEDNRVRDAAYHYLKDNNYESVIDWAKDNLDKHKYKYIDDCIKDNSSTNTKQVDLSETINTFIDNIENSSMLSVQTDLDSIDDFFNNDSAKIDIVTIDTKIPIITITALKEDEYKFELNVTDNAMSSTFTTTDKFNKLIDLAISELNENNEFYKYADDLNNCL